jgi:hypothetical protein
MKEFFKLTSGKRKLFSIVVSATAIINAIYFLGTKFNYLISDSFFYLLNLTFLHSVILYCVRILDWPIILTIRNTDSWITFVGSLIINFMYLYLLSCIIVFVYQKIKGAKSSSPIS